MRANKSYESKRKAASYLNEGVLELINEVLIKHHIAILEASKEEIDAAVRQERQRVIRIVQDAVEEFTGSEQSRHPMFSEGYDHALSHIGDVLGGIE